MNILNSLGIATKKFKKEKAATEQKFAYYIAEKRSDRYEKLTTLIRSNLEETGK